MPILNLDQFEVVLSITCVSSKVLEVSASIKTSRTCQKITNLFYLYNLIKLSDVCCMSVLFGFDFSPIVRWMVNLDCCASDLKSMSCT